MEALDEELEQLIARIRARGGGKRSQSQSRRLSLLFSPVRRMRN
jgi:hypothetical protein